MPTSRNIQRKNMFFELEVKEHMSAIMTDYYGSTYIVEFYLQNLTGEKKYMLIYIKTLSPKHSVILIANFQYRM